MSLKTMVILTGVSGGGKTTSLRALEDLGFYCVDNLPLPLLERFLETMELEPQVEHVALVLDARLKNYVEGYAQAFKELRSKGYNFDVVYFDANDEALLRRFSQTRRAHPLDRLNLLEGVAQERDLLAPLRETATVCVDSSKLTPHELRALMQERYATGDNKLVVNVLSFGFRYGLPAQSDVVFDVRFLPNPYFLPELKDSTGQKADVAQFVLNQPDAREFFAKTLDLITYLLPRYKKEGKVYLTIAIGCTGGRHRSVAIASALAEQLAKKSEFATDFIFEVRHRDVEKQL